MSTKLSAVSFLTGKPGTGKSYWLCMWTVDYFLKDEPGILITNVPLYADKIEEFLRNDVKRYPNVKNCSKRIEIIPDEEIVRWAKGESGPWSYFAGRNLAGAHIALDEAHHIIGKKQDPKIVEKWVGFLGEIRHQGATIEFITQSESKFHVRAKLDAETKVHLNERKNQPDPLFGIPLGYWSQLTKKFFGFRVTIIERITLNNDDGKWKEIEATNMTRWPKYYRLYDSYKAPVLGGESGEKPEMWELKTHLGLLWWFIRTAGWRLIFNYPMKALCLGVFAWWVVGFVLADMPKRLAANAKKRMDTVRQSKSGEAVQKPAVVPTPVNDLKPKPDPMFAEAPKLERSELEVLREKVTAQKLVIAGLVNNVRKLTEIERDRTALAMITPNYVVLSNGLKVFTGDEISQGEYRGLRLMEISFPFRRCSLSDGRVLHYDPVRMRYQSDRPDDTASGVSQPLQDNRTNGEAPSQRPTGGAVGDSKRGQSSTR